MDFHPNGWETVAVVPFTGDEQFTDAAAHAFAQALQNQPSFRIVPVHEVAPTARRLGINPAPPIERDYGIESVEIGITAEEAQEVGRALNADAVLLGTVRVIRPGGETCGLCIARLIDVSSGEVVATRSNSTGIRLGLSERDSATMAATRTGTAMRDVLTELSRRIRHGASVPPAP